MPLPIAFSAVAAAGGALTRTAGVSGLVDRGLTSIVNSGGVAEAEFQGAFNRGASGISKMRDQTERAKETLENLSPSLQNAGLRVENFGRLIDNSGVPALANAADATDKFANGLSVLSINTGEFMSRYLYQFQAEMAKLTNANINAGNATITHSAAVNNMSGATNNAAKVMPNLTREIENQTLKLSELQAAIATLKDLEISFKLNPPSDAERQQFIQDIVSIAQAAQTQVEPIIATIIRRITDALTPRGGTEEPPAKTPPGPWWTWPEGTQAPPGWKPGPEGIIDPGIQQVITEPGVTPEDRDRINQNYVTVYDEHGNGSLRPRSQPWTRGSDGRLYTTPEAAFAVMQRNFQRSFTEPPSEQEPTDPDYPLTDPRLAP